MDGKVGVEDGGEDGAQGGRGGGERLGGELLLLEQLVGVVVAGVEGEPQLLALSSTLLLLFGRLVKIICLLVCLSDTCPTTIF